MLATIVICLVLASLVFLAARRIRKKGTCDCGSCEQAGRCPGSAAKGK